MGGGEQGWPARLLIETVWAGRYPIWTTSLPGRLRYRVERHRGRQRRWG